MISCASGEYRYFRYSVATSRVPLRSTTLSTTVTGGSARMLSDGSTICTLSAPSSLIDRNASFSHASSTSPMPRCTNVVVEPRAPVSSTGTFLNSLRTYSFAVASLPPGCLQRPGPAREIIPARAARGLRIRRDDGDAGLGQVAPVADVLRISLAHQEHDRRRVGRAVVRQARLPVHRQQLAVRCNRIDVAGERERDDVGGQAVDDRARLLARAAVRLLDRDVVARLGFPVLGEGRVVLLVQLACRIVGHVQQRHLLRVREGSAEHKQRKRAPESFDTFSFVTPVTS